MLDKKELKPILEALIFAADSALGVDRLAGILEGEERAVIKEALDELVAEYAEAGRGFTIEEVAGGYQYRTGPEYAPYLRRLFKIGLQRISKPAMEALAIVAYKQPVTRAEVESIRGVDSGGVLATLMEKRFIRIVGRKELPGRPVVYGTTKEFLETFDLNDLSCLPSLKDIQKMEEENGAQDTFPEEENRVRDEQAGEENNGAEAGQADGGETAAAKGPAEQAGAGTAGGETDDRHEEEHVPNDADFEEFLGAEFEELSGEDLEELPDEAVQELSGTDRSAGEEENDGEGRDPEPQGETGDGNTGGEEGAREAEADGQDNDAGEESGPGPQDETGAQGEAVGGDADERNAEEGDGSGRGQESGGEDREETAGEDSARRPAEAPEDNSDGGDSVPEKG